MTDALPGGEPVAELRRRALDLDPAAMGLGPTPRHPNAFGVIMETGFESGFATLVVFSDGTASLYMSNGSAIIGGGTHPPVAEMSAGVLDEAEKHMSAVSERQPDEPPGAGRVVIHVHTFSGRVGVEAAEDDLGYGRHPLSPLFHAAHELIAELYRIQDAAG